MEKTKEEELSELIVERMKKQGATPAELPWVAMDEDGEVYAFTSEPRKSWRDPTWAHGVSDTLFLGNVPKELRLWPWSEFLLRWGPFPEPVTVAHLYDQHKHDMRDAMKGWEMRFGESRDGSATGYATDHCSLSTPPFQKRVWAADVMGEAFCIQVAILQEPLPSPQEVPHWRLPTEEELDHLLPGGWTEICPLDV